MAGKKGRSGGPRGGGRPPKRNRKRKPPRKPPAARGLPWERIREASEAGAEETEIVRALEISESALGDQATLTRFRDVLAVGHARYLLELRKTIKKRGLRTTKSAGSVNALSLQARNQLDWDKLLPVQETEPDLGTARQRLKDLLVRLAESRSEIEGKRVTPLALLDREARAVEEAHARAEA
jgi:hypothetical protein